MKLVKQELESRNLCSRLNQEHLSPFINNLKIKSRTAPQLRITITSYFGNQENLSEKIFWAQKI